MVVTRRKFNKANKAKLLRLEKKAVEVQTDWHNGDATEEQADAAVKDFEDFAIQIFDRIEWHGLYPTMYLDGRSYILE